MIAVPAATPVPGVHVVAAVIVVSPAPVMPGIHVAPDVRVMSIVAPAALVLVRSPIAALAAESDVGVLSSVPLVLCAHTATLYP
ncbi:hypothetical protein HMPREF3159_11090 [Brachybacterium sp. HMSC06H03]|uniref:hypothetical protein n=1 Tax=Brachybacterium sp. HMSC06H03 TaxID=1581127 RepID=UPI0008A25969|nr:hypothetical protein [Brachybacterium sp. HMSC06H03]OFT53440.1 hypothetical protein HMPREF3159_11090 [Brachybacterium sp. HMSC06H03]